MAVFRCKMCGGTLEVVPGASVIECEYCGTRQTLPRLDEDKKANLYDRANHFRRNNEFDKAMGIYEQILDENSEDAESYWSIVLCRYGVEYVREQSSGMFLPTITHMIVDGVQADEDYENSRQDEKQFEKPEKHADKRSGKIGGKI